ncbi:hypothetical protein EZS27_044530, partial [termite gut metagenome]
PFLRIKQKWLYTVLTHVWGYCYRIHIPFVKKGAGIHLACVAKVAALGVGNKELIGIVFFYVFDRFLIFFGAGFGVELGYKIIFLLFDPVSFFHSFTHKRIIKTVNKNGEIIPLYFMDWYIRN